MSFNRKSTTYVNPSVNEMLRAAVTEQEVDDAIRFAAANYRDATNETGRKWCRTGERVKSEIRRRRLTEMPKLVLP